MQEKLDTLATKPKEDSILSEQHLVGNLQNSNSKNHFLRKGDTVEFVNSNNIKVSNSLEPLIYEVCYDKFQGKYFLKIIEDFEVPSRLYGNVNSRVNRIIASFKDRNNSTGILLSGSKGSGKTMLTRVLSSRLRSEYGYPTLIVSLPYSGPGFNQFLQDLDHPALVIFDEFEKVYDNDTQEELLTLLDGMYTGKKLFVFTCNASHKISEFMLNRPGRILYHIKYGSLEQDFIREYSEENLKNKSHIESLVRLTSIYYEFSFDMLKAFVEDMNRFDESPVQILDFINAKPDSGYSSEWKLSVKYDNQDVYYSYTSVNFNPLKDVRSIRYAITKEDYDEDNEHDLVLSPDSITRISESGKEYTYQIGNVTVKATKKAFRELSNMHIASLTHPYDDIHNSDYIG